jgi:hypothetical protein
MPYNRRRIGFINANDNFTASDELYYLAACRVIALNL